MAREQRRDTFLELIGAARQRIILSMFRCTDFKIMDALADAQERGVSVELLLTQRAKGWEKRIRELGQYLESMGAKVHRYGEPRIKYHAKYLVIDGSRALIASMNLMKRYFEKTSDFLLATDDPDVAASLERLFRHDIEHPGQPVPEGLSPRLVVGPEMSRARLGGMIESARKSLVIADHRITDRDMIVLLEKAEQRGVRVVIFGKNSLARFKSHGRAMIVDGARAMIGSISMAPPCMDLRRELAVTFDAPGLVAELARFLDESRARHPAETLMPVAVAVESGHDDEHDDEDEKESDE
ncbi:MAG: hypothetical protein HXY18_09475 [Bryobacteraceae bacterium]|nr:hypothetical protein [Bryobacteraceae bacterium]